MKMTVKKAAVFKWIFFVVLVVAGVVYYPYLDSKHIRLFIEEKSTIAPLLFILICAVRPIVFYLPSAGLTIIAGILFGLYRGTLYVSIGGALSTVTGYMFAKWMGRGLIQSLVKQNRLISKIEKYSQSKGWRLVLYMRIFNLPWDVVSYWSALAGIPFKEYYFSSLIVLVPMSFIYTLLGSNITRPTSKGFIISLSIIFFLGALPFILDRLKRKHNET